MRTLIIATVSAISFGCLTTSATATTWQNRILGQISSNNEERLDDRETSVSRKWRGRSLRRPARIPVRLYKSYARQGDTIEGLASYYWDPQPVASGGRYNPNALTAAHRSLPFGTRVRVTNLRNGRSVVVRINDRGPYIQGRVIDLSRRAATIIRMRKSGVVPVRVDIIKLG